MAGISWGSAPHPCWTYQNRVPVDFGRLKPEEWAVMERGDHSLSGRASDRRRPHSYCYSPAPSVPLQPGFVCLGPGGKGVGRSGSRRSSCSTGHSPGLLLPRVAHDGYVAPLCSGRLDSEEPGHQMGECRCQPQCLPGLTAVASGQSLGF